MSLLWPILQAQVAPMVIQFVIVALVAASMLIIVGPATVSRTTQERQNEQVQLHQLKKQQEELQQILKQMAEQNINHQQQIAVFVALSTLSLVLATKRT